MTRIQRRSRFAIVPEWLVTSAALSDRAVRVYALLARYADNDGASFHPRRKIATALHCSPASLDRAIAELVAVGALTVEPWYRDDGSRGANNYVVEHEPPSAQTRGALITGDEGGLRTGDEGASSPVMTQQREPDNESHGNEKETLFGGAPVTPTEPSTTELFDAFWSAFEPKVRRVGKGDARKAWATAVKSTDPAVILAGQARYNDEIRGGPTKYRKTPGPWLRAERWADEPGANADRGAQTSGARQRIANHDGPAGRVVNL